MFDRVFKRKEDSAYADLSRRKSKVDGQKAGKRPQTAPSSISMSSSKNPLPTKASAKRSSLQDGLLLYRELQKRPGFPGSLLTSTSSTPQPTDSSSHLTSTVTESSRPSIGRATSSASSTSYELRNPFRSNTSESITTVSMCRSTSSESLTGTMSPVERTVPTYYPERTNGSSNAQPHKAAIFTSGGVYARATSDAFVNESSSDRSGTPSSSSVRCSRPQRTALERPPSPPKRHQWSFIKSPKHGSKDFLQVHIPSGVMSPPIHGHRHFWSSKA